MALKGEHCDDHTGMHSDIQTNGVVLKRVDESVKLLFKMHGILNKEVGNVKIEILAKISELKESIIKAEAKGSRRVIDYGVKALKVIGIVLLAAIGGGGGYKITETIITKLLKIF